MPVLEEALGKVLFAGFGTGASEYQFPTGIAVVDAYYDVFVTSTQQHHVRHTDASGNFIYQFGIPGSNEFGFNLPTGIALDQNYVVEGEREYNIAYVVDSGNDRVMIYASDFGVPLGQIGESGSEPGQFNLPAYVAVYHPYVPTE